MAYRSRFGRRPDEYASKSSHSPIIQDPEVVKFLEKCHLPKNAGEVELNKERILHITEILKNPIKHIVAVDGGYQDVSVKQTFPSSTLAFFQTGALFFTMADLDALGDKPFIDPADISRINNIERFKFSLPTKNINVGGEQNLTCSIRLAFHQYLLSHPGGGDDFVETIQWLIFQEYNKPIESYNLASCPTCEDRNIVLERKNIQKDFTFLCPKCRSKIYLIDIFRLHEAIDNEIGAGGILGYVTVLFEQIVIVHLIRLILRIKPSILNEILFIKDGPLAFFGQTANMHKPVRQLTNWLFEKQNLYLVGLEKSGVFVEHAYEIASKLKVGEVLLLDNDHIYKYILPGGGEEKKEPYARTSYYSGKLIFKADEERIYVLTFPTENEKVFLDPKKEDFRNLDVILHNVRKLKCDMFDNSLFPIALANKLVSLSNHPSSVILEKFAKEKIT